MEWPPDIEDHILILSLTSERRKIVDDLKKHLVPHRDGSTDSAFFFNNEERPTVAVSPHRTPHTIVGNHMPSIFLPFYQTYPDDTSFSYCGITFLSEREIVDRYEYTPSTLVDFGYVYAGMGHIRVFTYDRSKDCVLTLLDGGANGYDREDNYLRRMDALNRYATDGTVESVESFDAWWSGLRSHSLR